MYIQLSNMQAFEGNMYSIVCVFYMYLFFQFLTHHYIFRSYFLYLQGTPPIPPMTFAVPRNFDSPIYTYTHIHTHTWFTKCCAWFHQNKNPSFHVENCCWFISGRFIHLTLLSWVGTFHRIRTRFSSVSLGNLVYDSWKIIRNFPQEKTSRVFIYI